jgi:hypothetical protein
MSKETTLIPPERIENHIYLIQAQRVMLDFDLAKLYRVKTKVLNQAVKRNRERFPKDFMFSLTRNEILRMSQIVTSSGQYLNQNIKYYKNINAFTENGVAMLSSVLRSKAAIQVNIQIMRAFTKLRQVFSHYKKIAGKLCLLEQLSQKHDHEIQSIFQALRKLTEPPPPSPKPPKRIGFVVDQKERSPLSCRKKVTLSVKPAKNWQKNI